MKHSVQRIAVLMIALLAGLPVLAGITCSNCSSLGARACSMDMGSMASDCTMSQAELRAYSQDCCLQSQAAVVTQIVDVFKLRHIAPVLFAIPSITANASQPSSMALTFHVPESNSPPVYIRNRVFRI